MNKVMKAAVCGLTLVASLGLGIIVEAGSIPTNKVPLHTYAVRKINTYQQIGGRAKGWIDPGDYVIVNQIRSDGWAYGSYPVGRKRVSRWFRANDLINNVGFANQEKTSPQEKITVYRESSYRNSLGSVWGREPITVVSNAGDSRQVIYKISGGYKMGWIPSRYVPDPIPPVPVPPNPIINPVSREQSAKRSVYVYTDNSLTNYYGNCWLVKDQKYIITESKGNALKVKFNNRFQNNKETIGWVTNDIQQNLDFTWPTASKHLSVVYYYRNTKGENGRLGGPHSCHYHENGGKRGIAKPLGVDIAGGNDGQEVRPAEGGTVIFAGWDNTGFGNKVIVDHGEGKYTLYGHLKYQPNVKINQYVEKNQRIGLVGNTHSGNYRMGSHLHFEMSWMSPYEYFKGKQAFTYEEPAKTRNVWYGANYWSNR